MIVAAASGHRRTGPVGRPRGRRCRLLRSAAMPLDVRPSPAGDAATSEPGLPIDLPRTLGWYRHGRFDPTTRLDAWSFVRASWTPDGPAEVRLDWSGGDIAATAWGPGAAWAVRSAMAMTAVDRPRVAMP